MNGRRFTPRLAMVARRLGCGRNILRRPADRIEIAVVLAAIALTVAAVPLALSIGSAVYQRGLAISAEQTAGKHPLTATLVQSTPVSVELEGMVTDVPATARWTAPDGSHYVGQVQAPQGSATGTSVRIWTDAHGTQVGPALSPAQAWDSGGLTVIGVLAAVVVLLATLVGIVHWWLNRRRFAEWDAAWQRINPRRITN